MTAQELLDQAIVELGNLRDGAEFIVRDLFKGHIWNNQSKTDRLTLGTLFLNFARQNPKKIEILDKNSANQQRYRLLGGSGFRPASAVGCFIETGIMTIAPGPEKMIMAVIGTSGLNRQEISIKSDADVEKVASILRQALADREPQN